LSYWETLPSPKLAQLVVQRSGNPPAPRVSKPPFGISGEGNLTRNIPLENVPQQRPEKKTTSPRAFVVKGPVDFSGR
jgi:hypothetical protein